MKKRLVWILLAFVLLVSLTGCCLKHNYAPATCTAPSTCTKCGKTQGAALGHTEAVDEAKAPTCTETGLTEGKHCSVCNEVLVKQEEVPATGHTPVVEPGFAPTCTKTGLTDGTRCSVCNKVIEKRAFISATGHTFAPVTFLHPATCTVCGATEGEAGGTEYLLKKLLPMENCLTEKLELFKTPEKAVLTLSGQIVSGGESIFPAEYSLQLTTNIDSATKKLTADVAVLKGTEQLFSFMAGFEGDEFLLWNKEDGSPIYSVKLGTLFTWADLEQFLALGQLTITSSSELPKQYMDLLEKYFTIFVNNLVNETNTAEAQGTCTLKSVGKEIPCTVLTFNPQKSDWSNAVKAVLSTLKEDEAVLGFFGNYALGLYNADPSAYSAYASAEAYAEDMLELLKDEIDVFITDADSLAELFAGASLTFAYEGERLYTAAFSYAGETMAYESYGTAETGRTDALVLYYEAETQVLFSNTLSLAEDTYTGEFAAAGTPLFSYTFAEKADGANMSIVIDCGFGKLVLTYYVSTEKKVVMNITYVGGADTSAQLTLTQEPTDTVLTFPAGEHTEILSEEELRSIFSDTAAPALAA